MQRLQITAEIVEKKVQDMLETILLPICFHFDVNEIQCITDCIICFLCFLHVKRQTLTISEF